MELWRDLRGRARRPREVMIRSHERLRLLPNSKQTDSSRRLLLPQPPSGGRAVNSSPSAGRRRIEIFPPYLIALQKVNT